MRRSGVINKIIGFTLIILSFIGGWAWMDYQNALNLPVVTGKQVYIEINKGDSLTQITDKLVEQNLTIKPFWFKVIAFQEKVAKKLKTGEYELTPGLTIPEILALFEQRKTKQYAITFLEGWSFNEIVQEVERNPYLEHTFSFNHPLEPNSPSKTVDFQDVMFRLGADTKSPEGLFFPDTYFFEKHMSDVSLLKRAYDKMQLVLQQEWLNKAENLPFETPYEALILASIIEKEAATVSERPLIAGVFIRRLENDMLLQTDPTVIYGMGKNYRGDIGFKDIKAATPYNTYVIKGLPPTPIAMPGHDAIYAALHPDKGKSLYFVARGDGTHVFSSTLKDHNQAVDIYQRKKK
jgi:UPF0755 protein